MATDIAGAIATAPRAGHGFTVSTMTSEILIIVLVVIAIITNVILHHVESWIGMRHRNLYVIVNIIYRELMILGLISFCFILYELVAHPDAHVIMSFEVAHLFIFLLAIVYTVVVFSAIVISLRMSHRWKRMEALTINEYHELEAEHNRFLRSSDSETPTRICPLRKPLVWYATNLFSLPRYLYVHEVVSFHDARASFINNRGLPPTFRFSTFLRKIKSVVFLDLVESHRSLHIILLLIILADIARRRILRVTIAELDIVESTLIILAAFTLSAVVHVLAVKIRRVYIHMTTDPAVLDELYSGADEASLQPSEEGSERTSGSRRRGFISLEPLSGNEADNDEEAIKLPYTRERLSTVQAATVSELLELAERDAAKCMPNNEAKLRPAFRGPGARGRFMLPEQAPELCRTAVVHSLDGYLFRNAQSLAEDSERENSLERLNNADSVTGDVVVSARDSEEIREIVEKIAPKKNYVSVDLATIERLSPEKDDKPAKQKEALGPALSEAARPSDITSEQPTSGRGVHSISTEGVPLGLPTLPMDVSRAKSFIRFIKGESGDHERPAQHAAEKHFWLGSHHLFLWCVEFVMFFSTVLLSTACTGMALMALSGRPVCALHVCSLLAAVVNVLHVLVRIAGIIKKYIIVLHNGGLIPEIMAMETIKRVRSKPGREHSGDSGSGSADSNVERDFGWRRTMRRKLRRNSAARRRIRSASEVEGHEFRLQAPGTPMRAAESSDA